MNDFTFVQRTIVGNGIAISKFNEGQFFMLNATCMSCLNGLLLFFALKRGWTVFVRALKRLSGPISDCRLIIYSVLYYFVGNEGL